MAATADGVAGTPVAVTTNNQPVVAAIFMTTATIAGAENLAFVKFDDDSRLALWTVDAAAPTVAVQRFSALPTNSIELLTPSMLGGGTLFFKVQTDSQSELWKLDGLGASLVKTLAGGVSGPVDVGGRLFFTSGGGLFVSDGTAVGTHEVFQNVANTLSVPTPFDSLTNFNGRLVFNAGVDVEPWIYNPADPNDRPHQLKNINQGRGASVNQS